MTPSEIRVLLLEQHRRIRELADATLDEVKRVSSGSSRGPAVLRRAVDALAAAIFDHNRDEQRLLEDALSAADSWGAVRCAAMTDHHRQEHSAMRATLDALARDTGRAELADRLIAFIADLRRHMDVEERVLLHPHVLRDDVCAIDSFGG